MNYSNYSIFEEKVYNILKGELAVQKDILASNSIDWKINDFNRFTKNDKYSSEVSIYFFEKGFPNKIFDVLEFFIYKNNEKNFSIEELKEWLSESIRDIVENI